ncbi:MAG: phospholipase D-like domain-containing protein [Bacteroidaceae bacterium]
MKSIRLLYFLLAMFSLQLSAQESSDSIIVHYLEKQGLKFTSNNKLVFFERGKDKFIDMFEAIRQAKQTIHLEYFNFRNDSIANALFDLLAQKVKQGVKVRALFDGFGNDSNNKPLKKHHLKTLRAKGIDIHEFDPVNFPWVNHALHRDHRKIVVIDGQVAYTGGMNVADYYIHGKPAFGDWRDIHFRIEGDAVGQLQTIFLRIWNKVTHQNIYGAELYPGEKDASLNFKGLRTDKTPTAGKKLLAVVNREPITSPKIIRETFLEAINSAHTTIQIINPYFTLNRNIKRALIKAIERGVKVEIMVSEKSDIPITPRIVDYNVHKLMKHGASIYYYQGGFHHSKILMIDGKYCFAGSANLNARSLAYDYECNVMIIDPYATKELQQMFDYDKKKNCLLMTEDWWKSRSKSLRTQSWLFHFLAPFV